MRLPWPFGRAQRSPSSSDAGSGPSVSNGASAPVERPSGDAWRRLPPLAETVGPPPLVAPNRPFAAGLAAGEPPPPILTPLSHGRSLEAPKGLVSGIARPTTPAAMSPLPAPVQRSPLAGRVAAHHAELQWPDAPDEPAPEPAPVASPAAAAPESPPAPIRRLEPVTTASIVGRALTKAPEPARAPAGTIGPARAAGSRAPVAAPMAGIQRAPAAPAAAPSTATPVPAPAAEPVATAPRLTIGQARRLGLGAPVAGGPVTATASGFRGTPSGSAPAAPGPAISPAPARGPAGIQRAPEPSSPAMPLATAAAPHGEHELRTGEPSPPAGPSAASPPAGAPVLARLPVPTIGEPSPQPAGQASTPIVSAQPLKTRVQRAPITLSQRAADGAAAATAAVAPAPVAASSSGDVKIHRDGPVGEISKALAARSFTHGGEIYLPSSHGPLTSGAGRALLAHEMTHVAQQRRLGTSLPTEDSASGRRLEADAVAAERAPALVLAGRADRGDRGERDEPASAPAEAPAAAPSAVPRTAAESHAPGPQRAPESGGKRTLEMGPITLLSGGDQKGPSRPDRHTHTEQELEVLAHQLYHRIGRHLRRELLVDRERLGFALDLP